MGGEEDRSHVSRLRMAPELNVSLSDKWYVTLFPSQDIAVDFLHGGGKWFVPADSSRDAISQTASLPALRSVSRSSRSSTSTISKLKPAVLSLQDPSNPMKPFVLVIALLILAWRAAGFGENQGKPLPAGQRRCCGGGGQTGVKADSRSALWENIWKAQRSAGVLKRTSQR